MRIACPECEAVFEVPDGAIKPEGRKVRCSQCSHIWRQMPLADPREVPATDVPVAPPETETHPPIPKSLQEPRRRSTARRPRPAVRNRQGLHPAFIWLFLLILCAGLGWLIYQNHETLRAGWSPDSHLYQIPDEARLPDLRGFSLIEGDSAEWVDEPQTALRIHYRISNIGARARFAPELHLLLLRDANLQKSWIVPPPQREIEIGEILDYRMDLTDFPAAYMEFILLPEEDQAQNSAGWRLQAQMVPATP